VILIEKGKMDKDVKNISSSLFIYVDISSIFSRDGNSPKRFGEFGFRILQRIRIPIFSLNINI